jgi:hypothetical protein
MAPKTWEASGERPRQARAVLRHSPALAEAVRDGITRAVISGRL